MDKTQNGRQRPGVIGYARVSTLEQAHEGISLEAQESRMRAYARAHDLDLVAVEIDAGVSGKRTENRAALQRALAALAAGEADGLVVVKLDRLSRTTRDVLDLVSKAERESWALHSIEERLDTASPHGRFVVTVLAALSQMEREQVATRTKAAMAELRRQGKRISGRPPFGYRFEDGHVVEVPAEQAILREMLRLQAEGLGPYAIATALNEAGLHNPRTNRRWFWGTLRAVLRSAAQT